MSYNRILTNSQSTNFAPENAGRFPLELKELRQWVCWKKELVDGKPRKVPINPNNGKNASTTDRNNWSDFDSALAASTNFDGIGFVFTEGDEFVGIDLDQVLDLETGQLDPEANEIVKLIDSYTEVSPSGAGLHIIAKGKLQGAGRRKNKVEIYDRGRYFCMTGNWFSSSPVAIRDCPQEIDEVYRGLTERGPIVPQDRSSPEEPIQPTLGQAKLHRKVESDDKKLLTKASQAGNGEKFQRLYYRGEWKAEYVTHSEADQAMCAMLAFWCNHDAARMDRLFRKSKLYRAKWDERRGKSTYGQITICKAIEGHLKFLQMLAINERKDPVNVLASELTKAIDLCPWKGRSGGTDLHVLKAHLAIILESRRLIHHADVRTIADRAGLQSINTISRSHARLKERGWLEITSVHKKGTSKANTYTLTIPSHLKDTLKTLPVKDTLKTLPDLPIPHPCVQKCSFDERSVDLWISNKGLGKTKQKIYEQLDETDGQSVKDLARRNWVRPATMRKHLHTLASLGLANYDSSLWYRGEKEPEEVAAQLGISGTLERQRAFHQEQREARNYLLSTRFNPRHSGKPIFEPEPQSGSEESICKIAADEFVGPI